MQTGQELTAESSRLWSCVSFFMLTLFLHGPAWTMASRVSGYPQTQGSTITARFRRTTHQRQAYGPGDSSGSVLFYNATSKMTSHGEADSSQNEVDSGLGTMFAEGDGYISPTGSTSNSTHPNSATYHSAVTPVPKPFHLLMALLSNSVHPNTTFFSGTFHPSVVSTSMLSHPKMISTSKITHPNVVSTSKIHPHVVSTSRISHSNMMYTSQISHTNVVSTSKISHPTLMSTSEISYRNVSFTSKTPHLSVSTTSARTSQLKVKSTLETFHLSVTSASKSSNSPSTPTTSARTSQLKVKSTLETFHLSETSASKSSNSPATPTTSKTSPGRSLSPCETWPDPYATLNASSVFTATSEDFFLCAMSADKFIWFRLKASGGSVEIRKVAVDRLMNRCHVEHPLECTFLVRLLRSDMVPKFTFLERPECDSFYPQFVLYDDNSTALFRSCEGGQSRWPQEVYGRTSYIQFALRIKHFTGDIRFIFEPVQNVEVIFSSSRSGTIIYNFFLLYAVSCHNCYLCTYYFLEHGKVI